MTDPYALWDAAYMLGSLSGAERREYEAHLGGCGSCRAAVAELSGMPALLAMLSPADAAAIEEGGAQPPPAPVPPRVLDGLIGRVARRRRWRRWSTWVGSAAAAAVLVIGVLLAVNAGPGSPTVSPPPVAAATVSMTPMMPSSLEASVSLSSRAWGTYVEMTCTYRAEQGAGHDNGDDKADDKAGDEAGDKLALLALSRDGARVQLATWMAQEGATATPSGSTSLPMADIAAVQVVAADTGDVLLQHTL